MGDAIPSERHLSQQFGLSRMTVRQAVDTLVTDGVLVREQGRGTFVAPQRIDFEMRLTTFGEEMRRRGMEPATTVLTAQVVAATPDVATALEIEPRQKVHFLYRVRSADGTPICIEQVWVPVALAPGPVRRGRAAQHVRGAARHRPGPRVGRGHAVRRRGHRHRGVPARARRHAAPCCAPSAAPTRSTARSCSPAPATAPTATACGCRCAHHAPPSSPDADQRSTPMPWSPTRPKRLQEDGDEARRQRTGGGDPRRTGRRRQHRRDRAVHHPAALAGPRRRARGCGRACGPPARSG